MLPESFTPQFLKQLELLKLNARRSFLGSRQGAHLSQKRGHGIEFSEYRKYELGDNPRYIDWGVYAQGIDNYIVNSSNGKKNNGMSIYNGLWGHTCLSDNYNNIHQITNIIGFRVAKTIFENEP